MQNIIEALGGRKFIFAETLLICLVVLIVAKVDLETIKTFFNYALGIFATFVAGNVTSKFIQK